MADTIRGRFGHTSFEATRWCSSSSLVSMAASRIKGSSLFLVTVSDVGSSVTESWSLDSSTVRMLISPVVNCYSASASEWSDVFGLDCSFYGLFPSWCNDKVGMEGASLYCCECTGGGNFVTSHLRMNSVGSGSVSITVFGSNFGKSAYTSTGRHGYTSCEVTSWAGDSSVLCRAGSSLRSTKRLVLTAGSLSGSLSDAISIDIGSVSSLRRSNHAGTASASVTVHGANFGSFWVTMSSMIGFTSCERTEWESHTSIRGRVVSNEMATIRSSLTAGMRKGTLTQSFSSDLSTLNIIKDVNRDSTGSASITISGSSLGLASFSLIVAIRTDCECSIWVSETSILAQVSSGVKMSQRAFVTIGKQIGSSTHLFSYDLTLISGISPTNLGFLTQNISVILFSTPRAHDSKYSVRARLGGSNFESTQWMSETSVIGTTTPRLKANPVVMLTSSCQPTSLTQFISFDEIDAASSISPVNIPASGSESITLTGTLPPQIAGREATLNVLLGSTSCESTSWISSSAIFCKSERRIGGSHSIVIETDASWSTLTQAFSFDTASLHVQFGTRESPSGVIMPGMTFQQALFSSIGLSLTIVGQNFCKFDTTARVRLGQSTEHASRWTSDSSLSCKASTANRGGTLRLVLTSKAQGGTITEAFSLHSLSLSASSPRNKALLGFWGLRLYGNDVGHAWLTSTIRMGNTLCEMTEWVSQSSISAKAPLGMQSSRGFVVTGGMHMDSSSALFSFDLPTISVLQQKNLPAKGGLMSVHGENLGVLDATQTVRLGYTGCEASVWQSDLSVVCRAGKTGKTWTQRISLTVGDHSGSLTQAITTDLPYVTHVSRTNPYASRNRTICFNHTNFTETNAAYTCHTLSRNLTVHSNVPKTGSVSLTLQGANFGRIELSPQVSFGGTGCESTHWISDTTLQCLSMYSLGSTESLFLTIGVKRVIVTEAFSTDTAMLSCLWGANVPSTGSTSVTVMGASLGSSAVTQCARLGQTVCTGTNWDSDTSVSCLVARGARGTLIVMVTTGGDSATLSDGLSYSTPEPSQAYVYSLFASKSVANIPKIGTKVTIEGLGSGFVAMNSPKARVGVGTPCESTVWESDIHLVAKIGALIGAEMQLILTVGSKVGTLTNTFSTDAPSLSSSFPANKPATGASSITMFGVSLLPYFLSQKGSTGLSACEYSQWISDSSLHCKISVQLGDAKAQVITVGGVRNTLSGAVSADIPTISQGKRMNFGPVISVQLRVHGSNFGQVSYSLVGRMHTGMEVTDWRSETAVSCSVARGTMRSKSLQMTVIHQVGTLSASFSSDSPKISMSRLINDANHRTRSVTVLGANFESILYTEQVRLQQSACESSMWVSESSMKCKPINGEGGSKKMVLTLGQLLGTSSSLLSLDPSSAPRILRSNAGGTGSVSVTLEGAGLVGISMSAKCRFAQSSSEATNWQSSVEIPCLIAKGAQGSLYVVLTAATLVSSLTHAISFDRETVSRVSGQNSAVRKAIMVTNTGSAFGPSDGTTSGRVQHSACEQSRWVSETSLLSGLRHSLSSSLRTTLTAGNSAGSVSALFSSDSVVLHSFTQLNGRTTRSSVIAVNNYQFGRISFTGAVKVAHTHCRSTLWMSESTILCKTAGGIERSTRIVVTCVQRSGSTTQTYSFDVAALKSVTKSNIPSTGSAFVKIDGTRVGLASQSSSIVIGKTSCERSSWSSDTTVLCSTTSAHFASLQVSVTSGKQAESSTSMYSTDRIGHVFLQNANAGLLYSSSITVFGMMIDAEKRTATARVSSTAFQATKWSSIQSIQCKSSAGAFKTQSMILTSGIQVQSLSEVISYDLPAVNGSKNSLQNIPVLGSNEISVFGAHFGSVEACISARLHSSRCESTTWVSDTSILGQPGAARTASCHLVVTNGILSGSSTSIITYDSHSQPDNFVFKQNVVRTFARAMYLGVSTGVADYTATISVGHSACDASVWTSDTSLACKPAAADGASLRATVTAALNVGTKTDVISFDRLVIGGPLSRNSQVFGGKHILSVCKTLPHENSHSMRVGFSDCEGTKWISDSTVTCKASAGWAASRVMLLTAGIQMGSTSLVVSYDMIRPLASRNSQSTGSISVTVVGACIGILSSTEITRIHYTSCEATTWFSTTSVHVKTTQAVNSRLIIAISAGCAVGSAINILSFDAPSVSAARVSNSWCLAAQLLTCAGSGFGTADYCVASRMSGSTFATTSWTSGTSMFCKIARVFGQSQHIVVTSAAQLGSLTHFFSADIQSLSMVSLQNSPLKPNLRRMLFESRQLTQTSRIGQTTCEATSWLSDNSIHCLSATGSTSTLRTIVTAFQSVSSLSDMVSYSAPCMSSYEGANQPADSSTQVTILGLFMAHVSYSSFARQGVSSSEKTVWTAETMIVCKVAVSVSSSWRVSLSVGTLKGSTSQVLSYDLPFISTAESGNIPMGKIHTAATIIGLGTGFGAFDYTIHSMTGCSHNEVTVWASETSVLSIATTGSSGCLRAIMTAGRVIGTTTKSVSYDLPILPQTRTSNQESTGSASITIHGFALSLPTFEITTRAKISESACESTAWQSTTSVSCRGSAGVTTSRTIGLTVHEQRCSSSVVTSYASPLVSRLIKEIVNIATTDARVLTATGSSMGIAAHSVQMKTFWSSATTTKWISDSTILGKPARAAGSKSSSMVVSVAIQIGTLTQTLSIDGPQIQSVDVERSQSNGPVKSSRVLMGEYQRHLVVQGRSVGFSGATHSVANRIEGSACERSTWLSEVHVTCMPSAGHFQSKQFAITSALQTGSASALFSFNGPELHLGRSHNLPLNSRVKIYLGWLSQNRTLRNSTVPDQMRIRAGIKGTSFGVHDQTLVIRIGSTQCEGTFWKSVSALHARVSSGSRSTRGVILTLGHSTASVTHALSYESSALRIAQGTQQNAPTLVYTSSKLLLIFNSMPSDQMRVGSTSCQATIWTSISGLRCRTGTGSAFSSGVVLTATEIKCTMSNTISYDIEIFDRLNPQNLAHAGALAIEFKLRDVRTMHSSMLHRTGQTSCESTGWASESAILCKMPYGTIHSAVSVVTSGQNTGTITRLLSFDRKEMSAACCNMVSSRDHSHLRVTGMNLGTLQYSSLVRSGKTSCERSLWDSETSIACRSAKGEQQSHLVVLTAACQASTMTEAVSFDGSVGKFQSNRMKTRARHISLAVFGIADYSSMANFHTACEFTQWKSESSVVAKVVSGTHRCVRLTLTLGIQTESKTVAFSYDTSITSSSPEHEHLSVSKRHLSVFGTHFAQTAYSLAATLGHSSSEATFWQSDTAMVIQVARGKGSTLRVSVTSGNAFSTLTQSISYSLAAASSLSKYNSQVGGSIRMEVFGKNFGAHTIKSLVGSTSATISVWNADTALLCRISAGRQAGHIIIITSGGQVGTSRETLSYDAPIIKQLNRGNVKGNKNGGTAISLLGVNFGHAQFSASASIGSTASVGEFRWKNDKSVQCLVPQGSGQSKSIALTIGLIFGTLTDAVSYESPIVSTTRWLAYENTHFSVSLTGLSLGLPYLSGAIRSGGTSCHASAWLSSSSVVCRAHGFAVSLSGLRQAVTSGLHSGTLSSAFTYQPGVISSVSSTRTPTSGSSSVKIHGMHGISTSHGVRLGYTSSSSSAWVSVSSLLGVVPPGIAGRPLHAVVTAGRATSTITRAITYDGYRIYGACFSSPNSDAIQLQGQNFGVYDWTMANVKLEDNVGCKSSHWLSDTSASCKLLPGKKASDVKLQDADKALMCTVCEAPEVLDNCVPGISTGDCSECQSCPPGSQREGCVIGGFTRGSCIPCKSGDLVAASERTFKPIGGFSTDLCQPCTICPAYPTQWKYEKVPCSPTSDAVCEFCPKCEEGTILLGCGGSSPGTCHPVNAGIGNFDVSATVTLNLGDLKRQGTNMFVTQEATEHKIVLESFRPEPGVAVSVNIPAAVLITIGSNLTDPELQLSIIEPRSQLRSAGVRRAQSIDQSKYDDSKFVGPIVLLTPEGTSFAPPAALLMPFDTKDLPVEGKWRTAIFKFIPENSLWVEMTGSGLISPGLMGVSIGYSATYTVLAVEVQHHPAPETKDSIVASEHLVDLTSVSNVLSSTQAITRQTVYAAMSGSNSKTAISLQSGSLFSLPSAGEMAISVKLEDMDGYLRNAVSSARGQRLVSDFAVTFMPKSATISPSAKIFLPFVPPESDVVEIAIHYWNEKMMEWMEMPTELEESGVATTRVGTLSTYAVIAYSISSADPLTGSGVVEASAAESEPQTEDKVKSFVLPAAVAAAILIVGVASVTLVRQNRKKTAGAQGDGIEESIADEESKNVDQRFAYPAADRLRQQLGDQEKERSFADAAQEALLAESKLNEALLNRKRESEMADVALSLSLGSPIAPILEEAVDLTESLARSPRAPTSLMSSTAVAVSSEISGAASRLRSALMAGPRDKIAQTGALDDADIEGQVRSPAASSSQEPEQRRKKRSTKLVRMPRPAPRPASSDIEAGGSNPVESQEGEHSVVKMQESELAPDALELQILEGVSRGSSGHTDSASVVDRVSSRPGVVASRLRQVLGITHAGSDGRAPVPPQNQSLTWRPAQEGEHSGSLRRGPVPPEDKSLTWQPGDATPDFLQRPSPGKTFVQNPPMASPLSLESKLMQEVQEAGAREVSVRRDEAKSAIEPSFIGRPKPGTTFMKMPKPGSTQASIESKLMQGSEMEETAAVGEQVASSPPLVKRDEAKSAIEPSFIGRSKPGTTFMKMPKPGSTQASIESKLMETPETAGAEDSPLFIRGAEKDKTFMKMPKPPTSLSLESRMMIERKETTESSEPSSGQTPTRKTSAGSRAGKPQTKLREKLGLTSASSVKFEQFQGASEGLVTSKESEPPLHTSEKSAERMSRILGAYGAAGNVDPVTNPSQVAGTGFGLATQDEFILAEGMASAVLLETPDTAESVPEPIPHSSRWGFRLTEATLKSDSGSESDTSAARGPIITKPLGRDTSGVLSDFVRDRK